MYVAIRIALNNLLMVTIAFEMRSQLKENEQFPNKLKSDSFFEKERKAIVFHQQPVHLAIKLQQKSLSHIYLPPMKI